jgi:hypothetical protein
VFRLRSFGRSLTLAATVVALATLATVAPASGASSTVVKVNGTDLFCQFDTAEAGGSLFAITRDRTDGEGFAFVDLFIEPAGSEGPVLVGGKDDPALTSTGFHDSWDVVDEAEGDVIGTATVDATFTGTGEFRARRVYQDAVQMGIFEDLIVSGSLTVVTTGVIPNVTYTFDLAGCEAGTQDRVDQIHRPNGPKSGGEAPANDGPSGAIALAPGAATQQWTGGAAIESEAPCVIGEGDDAFEFGLGRTVWFSVIGTGDPITIDPRRSDFDTVVAAYASSADGLVQVGCVDDDDIGQAQGRLTFDTTPGTTYLVQIGGVIGQFGGDLEDPQWGRLRLHIS